MPKSLKMFAAVFAERRGTQCRIVTIKFHIEDEEDALEIAEDLAMLEGRALIYLFKVLKP